MIKLNVNGGSAATASMSDVDYYQKFDAMEMTFDQLDASQENFWRDMTSDGLIEAIVKRNNAKLEYLQEMLPECIERVKGADEAKFTKYLDTFHVAVTSKYLLPKDDFMKSVDAFKKLAIYVKGTNIKTFDVNKAKAFLKGTVFIDEGELDTHSNDYNVISWIPLVGWWKHIKELEEVQKKGWKTRKDFIDGLEKTKVLIEVIKMSNEIAKKYESESSNSNDKVLRKKATCIADICKFLSEESGHMGRGVIVAAKKITSGFWAKTGMQMTDR